MKRITVAICFALMLSIPLYTTAEAATNVVVVGGSGYIEKLSGTTNLYGGGNYVGIRFVRQVRGKPDIVDAMFGVLWGTENQAEPNSIAIFSEITRYLGAANVSDINGGLVARRYPLVVKTIWVQKLEDIFEYYDANDDGVADHSRDYPGLLYSEYDWHEPVYKRVSLKTAWTSSSVSEALDSQGKWGSWSFSLTAENLAYQQVALEPLNTTGDGILSKLAFTFHLNAQLVNVTAEVPHFEITVNATNSYDVISSEKVELKEFNGTSVNYGVKYDHEILGWDFDAKNPNPKLLLEWHAIVGNYIPPGTAKWMKEELLSGISGGTGDVVAETAEGNVTLNEENANATNELPQLPLHTRLKPARLTFMDDWQRLGGLTWITTVDVTSSEGEDPVTLNMTAQVQGHKRILVDLPTGIYKGFAMLGGFSYPAGYRIYHDPEVTISTNIMDISEIPVTQTPSPTPSPTEPTAGPITPAVYIPYAAAAVLATVLAVGTIVILKRRK